MSGEGKRQRDRDSQWAALHWELYGRNWCKNVVIVVLTFVVVVLGAVVLFRECAR